MNPEEVAAKFFKHLQRAQLLMEVARWREALHELNQHLARYPDTYGAWCNSALCHLELTEFQLALDMTKRAVEVSPEEEWAYRIRSAIFTKNGEPKRALDAAKLCIQKEPGSPNPINCLFWAQANCGALDDAEITLKSLLETIPGTFESHEAAGYLALKRKKNLEAEKHYLEALKLNPESTAALNNLGVVYLNLAQSGKGRHYQKQSVEMFERAVKLEPTFKLAQKNISTASNAIKVGVPGGLIFLIWMGVRVVSYVSGGISTTVVKSNPNDLALLSPVTSSYLLTAANLYFDILIIALVTTGFSCVSQRFRAAVVYELANIRGWLIPFLLFAAAVALYISAFRMSDIAVDEIPFSFLAIIASIIIVIFTGMNLIRRWNGRPA